MAKPNYRFDKRQRELKKAKKQDEKRLKKLARIAADDPGSADTAGVPPASDAVPAQEQKK